MFHSRTVEIWVGLFVAMGFSALFILAMQVSNLSAVTGDDGYEVTARFENISGLKVRSAVTMAGVKIGKVSDISFDPQTFEAVVSLRIDSQYDGIPSDTSASIFTAGLLGEKYVGLEAGGEEELLSAGSELELTQSSLILEQLIGQFLFSKAADGGDE